jgi:hypothetical protein
MVYWFGPSVTRTWNEEVLSIERNSAYQDGQFFSVSRVMLSLCGCHSEIVCEYCSAFGSLSDEWSRAVTVFEIDPVMCF